jgi:DNA-binding transcriptional regulator YiaG
MAKKKAAMIQATEDKRQVWAVRLEFEAADHEEIERIAKMLKLSKAGFARMAVMDRVRAEKSRMKE